MQEVVAAFSDCKIGKEKEEMKYMETKYSIT
jgi:hypothetical protein